MSFIVDNNLADFPYNFNFNLELSNSSHARSFAEPQVYSFNLLSGLSASLIYQDDFYDELKSYQIVLEDERLPEWWCANNNKLFIPLGCTEIPKIIAHKNLPLPRDTFCFVNGLSNYQIMLWGSGNFVYISPQCFIPNSSISVGSGVVFLGKKVRSAGGLNVNVRNFGSVICERDILFSNDCKLMSDDCHTILSTVTNERLNPYGGGIILGEHVWVGVQATLMGNTAIGSHNIIGERSFVRNIVSDNNAILAGVPAKILRTGITWDDKDLPP